MDYQTIRVIKEESKADMNYSFEKEICKISIVKDKEGKNYLREYKKSCVAESNGRPATYERDYLYPLKCDEAEDISEDNWRQCMLNHFCESIELLSKCAEGVF